MRVAWCSDLHFEITDDRARLRFYEEVRAARPDVLLVSGDIAGRLLRERLSDLHDSVPCPVLVVLGNHDAYGSFIHEARACTAALAEELPHLTYLPTAGVVRLTESTCVVGVDGWADARCGDYTRSSVFLSDHAFVRDLIPLGKWDRQRRLQELGDEAAAELRVHLEAAISRYSSIYVLTHVPPFAEACLYEGRATNDDWLPHMACKATGDTLMALAQEHLQTTFIVRCGHTHEPCSVRVCDNVSVRVAAAEYGKPRLADVWEVV